jgi:transcriptional regulator with XRE-family HTH domain
MADRSDAESEIQSAMIATGWRLRAARQHRGLSPEKLAELMNVSRPTLVGWESSAAGRYSVEQAFRLASVLGVRVGWLLSGQGARDAKVKP